MRTGTHTLAKTEPKDPTSTTSVGPPSNGSEKANTPCAGPVCLAIVSRRTRFAYNFMSWSTT